MQAWRARSPHRTMKPATVAVGCSISSTAPRHPDNRLPKGRPAAQGPLAQPRGGAVRLRHFRPALGRAPLHPLVGLARRRPHVLPDQGPEDCTQTLPERLALGDPATVEGLHGRFDFADDGQREIWLAGGMGIAPFTARMQALAEQPDGRSVDLFCSTSTPDRGFIAKVHQRAALAPGHGLVLRSGGLRPCAAAGPCRPRPGAGRLPPGTVQAALSSAARADTGPAASRIHLTARVAP